MNHLGSGIHQVLLISGEFLLFLPNFSVSRCRRMGFNRQMRQTFRNYSQLPSRWIRCTSRIDSRNSWAAGWSKILLPRWACRILWTSAGVKTKGHQSHLQSSVDNFGDRGELLNFQQHKTRRQASNQPSQQQILLHHDIRWQSLEEHRAFWQIEFKIFRANSFH